MNDAEQLRQLRADLAAIKTQKSQSILPTVLILLLVVTLGIGGMAFEVSRAKNAEEQIIASKKAVPIFIPTWTETIEPESSTSLEQLANPEAASTPKPIMSPVTAITTPQPSQQPPEATTPAPLTN